jgi:sulfoxide reductase heme-binding subunit YedZ
VEAAAGRAAPPSPGVNRDVSKGVEKGVSKGIKPGARKGVKKIVLIRRAIFAASLLPAAWLGFNAYRGHLTANPIEYLTHFTGDWALAFLVISLTVTPLRHLTGWNEIIKLRRMLGLFAFFYASLHLSVWALLDKFFDVKLMLEDIVMRRFITVGMAAFTILLALALTSNKASVRRLGRKWQTLHRLVYVAAVAGVIHFWWLVKADITLPRRWAVAVALLLGFRIWWAVRKRMSLAS